METFEKNMQIHGTTIQYSSQIDFGDQVCHVTHNWITFHKPSDRLQYEDTKNITASTIIQM
jgi:predicted small secreted protein